MQEPQDRWWRLSELAGSEVSTWALLGLGNPLPEYAPTRHNVGHRVVEEMARRAKAKMRRKGRTFAAIAALGPERFVIAKSLTYMNESGLAAEELMRRFGVLSSRLLVVCDDVNLPLGRLRLRHSGGDGGHKGLMSLIEVLGTSEFPRLRVGVGVLPPGEDAVPYVLGTFEEEERVLVEDTVRRAADCLETVIRGGLETAMNQFNRDARTSPESPTEEM